VLLEVYNKILAIAKYVGDFLYALDATGYSAPAD